MGNGQYSHSPLQKSQLKLENGVATLNSQNIINIDSSYWTYIKTGAELFFNSPIIDINGVNSSDNTILNVNGSIRNTFKGQTK